MRVLVLLTSDNRRGAEIQGVGLAAALSTAGIESSVIALAAGSSAAKLPIPHLGPKPLGPRTLLALRRAARSHDVVVAYGSSTLPACAIALSGTSRPFIYRSIGDPQAWIRGTRHARRTTRFIKRAARVAVLWPDAAKSITDLYHIDRTGISVIPNARSAEEFPVPSGDEREMARRLFGIDHDVPVVGSIGSIAPEKRLELAIDAVAATRAVHLLIIGDGPGRDGLELLARDRLGNRVSFAGAISDLRPAYAAVDLVLSTSRTEGMPGVLIEAALSGRPVVATNVGSVPWLFARGLRGRCVDADAAPLEIANQIEFALSSPDGRSRSLDDVCTWEAVLPRWISLLEEVSSTS